MNHCEKTVIKALMWPDEFTDMFSKKHLLNDRYILETKHRHYVDAMLTLSSDYPEIFKTISLRDKTQIMFVNDKKFGMLYNKVAYQ